jgi:hypothetical protein
MSLSDRVTNTISSEKMFARAVAIGHVGDHSHARTVHPTAQSPTGGKLQGWSVVKHHMRGEGAADTRAHRFSMEGYVAEEAQLGGKVQSGSSALKLTIPKKSAAKSSQKPSQKTTNVGKGGQQESVAKSVAKRGHAILATPLPSRAHTPVTDHKKGDPSASKADYTPLRKRIEESRIASKLRDSMSMGSIARTSALAAKLTVNVHAPTEECGDELRVSRQEFMLFYRHVWDKKGFDDYSDTAQ